MNIIQNDKYLISDTRKTIRGAVVEFPLGNALANSFYQDEKTEIGGKVSAEWLQVGASTNNTFYYGLMVSSNKLLGNIELALTGSVFNAVGVRNSFLWIAPTEVMKDLYDYVPTAYNDHSAEIAAQKYAFLQWSQVNFALNYQFLSRIIWSEFSFGIWSRSTWSMNPGDQFNAETNAKLGLS